MVGALRQTIRHTFVGIIVLLASFEAEACSPVRPTSKIYFHRGQSVPDAHQFEAITSVVETFDLFKPEKLQAIILWAYPQTANSNTSKEALQLAQDRINSIKAWLERKGVSQEKIQTIIRPNSSGYGESRLSSEISDVVDIEYLINSQCPTPILFPKATSGIRNGP